MDNDSCVLLIVFANHRKILVSQTIIQVQADAQLAWQLTNLICTYNVVISNSLTTILLACDRNTNVQQKYQQLHHFSIWCFQTYQLLFA
jgi:hypothetical protein